MCIRLLAAYLLLILFNTKGWLQEVADVKGRYTEDPSIADSAVHYNQFKTTDNTRSLSYKHSISADYNGTAYMLTKADEPVNCLLIIMQDVSRNITNSGCAPSLAC